MDSRNQEEEDSDLDSLAVLRIERKRDILMDSGGRMDKSWQ